ncbi:HSP20-like chaperone [Polychaeton citri CBS 116435]|uniref:HSP20-like chaperone n=1 Tax=Polychaeton citri CBS 116435 TaxID=1314669 RepID=A0A9P4Q7N4_9PEZI|nr:HSP20-like chaperone [Polychaeton citri CBS 116435]
MPSVRYYNQTAPFWDFVASMEDQGANHPFFGGNGNNNANGNNASDEEHDNPSDQDNHRGPTWGSWPFGPMPHRGRHGPHHPHRHHHGPPPPPPPPGAGEHGPEHGPPPPPEYSDEDPPISHPDEGEAGPSHPSHPHGPRGPWGGRHAGHGGRGRGWGGRGRNHCGSHARGGSGVPPFFAAGFPFAANLGPLADIFQSQSHLWTGNEKAGAGNGAGSSFKPEVDVFDTADAFVVHISLPGAKKEDVGVDWDAEKSELRVAGVVYRPGEEEFIKTLALDERRVGEFERKVRLGSRAHPAQVDVEGISAKLEDGILRIEVPKMESGFVEVRKVDIE